MSTDGALKQYFAEAASWEADRAAMSARSTRLAWRVAIGACVLTVVTLLALVALLPLKRVEPFVIRVDNATGIVDVVPAFAGQASLSEAQIRYFLFHYVTVCERFNHSTAESDFEECASFHAPALNQAWYAKWERINPQSPLNVYQDGSSIRAKVAAITFFKRGSGVEDLAQVRYVKIRRTPGRSTEEVTHWIATVQYVSGTPSRDETARQWNPLGFKVVDFHTEPEVLPSEGLASPSPDRAAPPAKPAAGAAS